MYLALDRVHALLAANRIPQDRVFLQTKRNLIRQRIQLICCNEDHSAKFRSRVRVSTGSRVLMSNLSIFTKCIALCSGGCWVCITPASEPQVHKWAKQAAVCSLVQTLSASDLPGPVTRETTMPSHVFTDCHHVPFDSKAKNSQVSVSVQQLLRHNLKSRPCLLHFRDHSLCRMQAPNLLRRHFRPSGKSSGFAYVCIYIYTHMPAVSIYPLVHNKGSSCLKLQLYMDSEGVIVMTQICM